MTALPASDLILDAPGRPWRYVPTNELLIELYLRDIEEVIEPANGSLLEGFSSQDIDAIRSTWVARIERDSRNALRFTSDHDLAAESESIRYLALEFGVNSVDRRVLQYRARVIAEEIRRRHQVREAHPDDPMRPPDPKRDKGLWARIEDAHRRYPMDRFCEEMLNVRLKRYGARLKGLCPFHKEQTPSFVVFPEGRARCFGCNQGGDIFDLTKIYFRIDSFYEALERIERTY